MKEKIRVMVIICVGAWLVCSGGYSPDIIKAMSQDRSRIIGETKGAKAREVLHVVDQDGVPVTNARVYGSFCPGNDGLEYILVDGLTNMDGEYVADGISKWKLTCQVTKDGYYMTKFTVDYLASTNIPAIANGKWQPYGTTRQVVLKKIKNPVVLVHSKSICPPPPSLAEWHGYDIERRQWTKPFGAGVHSDMLIRISINARNAINDFNTSMEVSFTNNPHAGAYMLKLDEWSEMQSVYEADSNELYQTSFNFIHERRPIKGQFPFASGVRKIDTRLDAHSYLVFRTRTKVDDNGNLVSAHYGKIYGLWEFFGGMRAGNVQFNPMPNDTNLEDIETARRSSLHCKPQAKPR